MVQVSEHADFLSTTRINRLLRPLRNKCSSLAAFGARTGSSSAPTTYSSVKSMNQPDMPPLCILSPPENSTRLDAASIELSRRIYAVYNAFKDVVEKTKALRIQSAGNNTARLPSLSTMCASVIGRHAEPDFEEDVTRLEEERSVDAVETLYKEIPALYRGSTLVSHSLHIILDECPLSPTLLKLLLDLCLNDNLLYHSENLLRNLLSIAISPPLPSRLPPICHPAHSNFLIELLGRWEQKGNPACVFFRILNETMSVVGTYDVWVCKATTKLLLHCQQNPLRLASVSANLVNFISKPELHCPSRQNSVNTTARTSPTGTLRRLLRVWLECVLRHLLFSVQAVDHQCFYDFLLTCKECWVHLTTPENPLVILSSPEQDVVSAIVSVTTFLLSQELVAGYAVISQVLSEKIRPSTTLFSPLISQTLALSAQLPDCTERIQAYAASLRKHSYLELETSLWSSALRELENFESLLQRYDKDALNECRNVLIDCVEDAEQRCYGYPDDVLNSPSVYQRNKCKDAAFRCSRASSPQSRKRPHSGESPDCVEGRTLDWSRNPNDWETTQPNKRPRLMPRRLSSFPSLLSNALSNHVVLHGERKQVKMNKSARCECSNDEVDAANMGNEGQTLVGFDDLSGETFESIIPSSDDCLDLLAYATSPVRG
ncbi:hypothetical protein F5890DRAFT_528932 [Lentinula detonsa]|uniref:Uncharacterized protein n=1 Tax=Lentinula detonsa TaxID=2804962 RepID=A0AA38UXM0_9AGAR|nr:hypothetical protein F5890DRAFT_528932 [Lentinula detonsa]